MLNKIITSPTQCPYCEGSDCCGRELEPDIDELEADNARLKGLLKWACNTVIFYVSVSGDLAGEALVEARKILKELEG